MEFERGKNIKDALEIGFFLKRNFNNFEDATTWLVQHYQAILGLDGPCDSLFTSEQQSKLKEYVTKYFRIYDHDFYLEDTNHLIINLFFNRVYRNHNYSEG